jgi:hypothetical protein
MEGGVVAGLQKPPRMVSNKRLSGSINGEAEPKAKQRFSNGSKFERGLYLSRAPAGEVAATAAGY